jgi:hypothetical protein
MLSGYRSKAIADASGGLSLTSQYSPRFTIGTPLYAISKTIRGITLSEGKGHVKRLFATALISEADEYRSKRAEYRHPTINIIVNGFINKWSVRYSLIDLKR